MARKRHRLERVLDMPSLAAVAYGEIGSSIYLALGIVALYAFGLTPWVLLAVGLLFGLVSMAYAEGTAATREAGGAASFVGRAFNDPAAFATGWVIFLDYLIVMALAALFVPHYIGTAFEIEGLTDEPLDWALGLAVVGAVTLVRLVRRSQLYRVAIVLAGLALFSQLLLVVIGFVLLFSPSDLTSGRVPDWSAIAFALALGSLAYTGLETVANFAAEARRPGRALPRSLFIAIGAVIVVTTLVAVVGIGAYPAGDDGTALGTEWVNAPMVGIAVALSGSLPDSAVHAVRIFVGLTGVLVLLAAITTSISGASRLAHALAQRQMLPRAFGRLSGRTLISPASILSAALLSSGLLVAAAVHGQPVRFLASLYSFGILLAFTAAQLAVLRLRTTEPNLRRPFRVPLDVPVGRLRLPLPTLIATPLTAALWVAAVATHTGARVAGPLWLAFGAIVYVTVRLREREGLLERVSPVRGDLVPEVEGAYLRIIVPLKGGPIGDEVLGTALKLAHEQGAAVEVVHVMRVPFDLPLHAPGEEADWDAFTNIDEAKELAEAQGVRITGEVIRARSIGEAIVERADESGADLIVMGSHPRWRRQSRFFSPTVDHVLRHARCEVMVVAYPQGVLEEE